MSKGVSVWGVSVQEEGLCPGGGSLSRRRVSVQEEGLCPGGGSLSWRPPPHRTVMCGRYASYWNAFLYLNVSMSKCLDTSRVVLQFQVEDVVLFSLSKNYGNVLRMELLLVYEVCAK